jgi:hypothetical protein
MLADFLQSVSALHRVRLTCLAAIVIALFKVKTVNLAQLTTAFPDTPNSNPLLWRSSSPIFYPMRSTS